MQCQKCGTENDDSFRFCMKCGSQLIASDQQAKPASADDLVDQSDQGISNDYVEQPQPSVQYTPPTPPISAQPRFQQPAAYQYQPERTFQRKTFGASQLSSLNIWGPFAGFGSRQQHLSWLMDGQGDKAEDLISKVSEKFQVREIPYAYITQETKVARGLLVESRPYFILRRGLVSLALYIAEFGKDMFVSLAAYLKPPISNFRVLLVSLMLIFHFYFIFFYPASVNNAFERASRQLDVFNLGSFDASALLSLLCIIGPLGMLNSLLIFILLVYSGYKWLNERDFLAALRVKPNEFNEDDLMAMSKAVEQTLRISLDEIGLNPDDLIPAKTADDRRII
jgi:hypothetical protein